MPRDIASAYVASGARIGAWVVVSALAFRLISAEAFAMLALVRATIGILNYSALGLAPAMIGLVATTRRQRELATAGAPTAEQGRRQRDADGTDPLQRVYANGIMLSLIYGAGGIVLAAAYAVGFQFLLDAPPQLPPHQLSQIILGMGAGIVLRLMSDSPGAALQAMGRIAIDNSLVALTELLWVVLSVLFLGLLDRSLAAIAWAYCCSGACNLAVRYFLAGHLAGMIWPRWALVDTAILRRLFGFGALVVAAQLADYLYAPADYILINKLIDPAAVAAYAPALQIDAGLLLMVSALAAVLLPKTALAHAVGADRTVRIYYVRGTLASLGLLAAAAVPTYLASPWIFQLWLGDPMPSTQAILPLVLAHTVIGGSSAVGRSILLAIGKARAFAASALIAGIANVVLGFVFVGYLGLGLNGIVLATILVVAIRCALWMPWYVLRSMNKARETTAALSEPEVSSFARPVEGLQQL